MLCIRAQHLQETRDELLQISDKLLDGEAPTAEIPALTARRQKLVALRAELDQASAAPVNGVISHWSEMPPLLAPQVMNSSNVYNSTDTSVNFLQLGLH